MSRYSFTHLADHVLPRELASGIARERGATADVLALIAEFDARKLYLPAAYPTMFAYLVGESNLSEAAASKRIQAARSAREFPAIFGMVADGRLHLTAIVCLAPHLRAVNSGELLAAASRKTKAQIQQLLAERYPQADVPTTLLIMAPTAGNDTCTRDSSSERHAISSPDASNENVHSQVLEPVVPLSSLDLGSPAVPLGFDSHGTAGAWVPGATAPIKDDRLAVTESRPRVAPLSPGRFELRTTLDQAAHDKLRRIQELLSHAVPSGDLSEVLGRALDLALAALEKRRFAATSRPSARRRSKSARHIPAHVRREVSDRDRYQCTFVSESGRRCSERRFLEYDHVHPVARGGEATIENTRLRCRAHNQYEAERIFGVGFMREKREAPRGRASRSRP